MTAALEALMELLGDGIITLATKVAQGANAMVRDAFFTYTESSGVYTITGLSTFGGIVGLFGGVALAIGFTTLIFNWIRSLGAR